MNKLILLPRPKFDALDGPRVDAFEKIVAKFVISTGSRPADRLLDFWSRELMKIGKISEIGPKCESLAADMLLAARCTPTRRPDPTR